MTRKAGSADVGTMIPEGSCMRESFDGSRSLMIIGLEDSAGPAPWVYRQTIA